MIFTTASVSIGHHFHVFQMLWSDLTSIHEPASNSKMWERVQEMMPDCDAVICEMWNEAKKREKSPIY